VRKEENKMRINLKKKEKEFEHDRKETDEKKDKNSGRDKKKIKIVNVTKETEKKQIMISTIQKIRSVIEKMNILNCKQIHFILEIFSSPLSFTQ